MSARHWTNPLTLRRGFISVLALVAASLLIVASASAQNILRNVRGEMERLKSTIEGDVSLLKEDVREEVAYLLGMELYVYGYPLVIMDVTKGVLTAAPAPNAEGTAAPINQLAKMPHYVSRISPTSCGSA